MPRRGIGRHRAGVFANGAAQREAAQRYLPFTLPAANGGELHLTASFSGGGKFEIDQVSDIANSRRAG